MLVGQVLTEILKVRILEKKYSDAWNAYRNERNRVLSMNRRRPGPDDKWVLDTLNNKLERMKWVETTIHNLWRTVRAQDAARRRR